MIRNLLTKASILLLKNKSNKHITYNKTKATNGLLFFISKIRNKEIDYRILSAYCYLADFGCYEKHRKPIFGFSYSKQIFGAFPIQLLKELEVMETNEMIEVNQINNSIFPQYKALSKANINSFNREELKVLRCILLKLDKFQLPDLLEFIKKDIPFLETKFGDIINYDTVFLRSKGYSIKRQREC